MPCLAGCVEDCYFLRMHSRRGLGIPRFGVLARRSRNAEIGTAVDGVFAVAPAGTSSLMTLVEMWGLQRGRPIAIEDGRLPVGVFGQWLSFPDRDVLKVRSEELSRERTIAHELGHMVLGHRGQAITEYATAHMEAASIDLVAFMLQRSCDETRAWPDEEIDAECFAGLVLRRLERAGAAGESSRRRIDDMFC